MKETLSLKQPENGIIINSAEALFTPEQIPQIAWLYADVFRGPPWNEAVKCNQDGKFKGPEIPLGSTCNCGGTFIEAYPFDETVSYIKSEIQKPGFLGTIAVNKLDAVIGFAWSYLTTPQELVQEKWSDSENQQAILKLLSQNGLGATDLFRYFCETGIAPDYRGLGLANYLTKQIFGSEPTLYRTNTSTPMMAVGPTLGFDQIMGPEVIVDRQQRITIPTGKIFGRLDSEREDRVLFFKKSL